MTSFAGRLSRIGLICLSFVLSIATCSDLFAQDGGAGFRFIDVKVVDQSGNPVEGATVDVSIDGMDFPMPADDQGVVSLNVPASGSRLDLGVRKEGFAAVGARWEAGQEIPDEITVPLEPGATIGGIVHDENGNPIEGVEVHALVASSRNWSMPKERVFTPRLSGVIGTTDAEGRWRCESAPEDEIQLQMRLAHPDFISSEVYRPIWTWEELQGLDTVKTMEKGITLEGRVTADGKPIEGASIALGSDRFGSEQGRTSTDVQGNYRLSRVPSGAVVATVYADGWAPTLRTIATKVDMEPVNFELEKGHVIRIRVTDPEGNPLAGVGVAPDTWRRQRTLIDLGMPRQTDEHGLYVWDSAPADEIEYDFYMRGRMSVRNQKLTARTEPYEIIMPPPLRISGTVNDAETGEPVEHFSVIQGSRFEGNDRTYWQNHNTATGTEGNYEMEFDEPSEAGFVLRVEAEGYRPGVSRVLRSDEGETTLDFELEKGSGPSGIVRLPNGQPAEGVKLMIATLDNNLYFQNGAEQNQSGNSAAVTDAEGRFQLPFPDDVYEVVGLHDEGWCQASESELGLDESNRLTLEPWAAVKGNLELGGKKLSGEQINLSYQDQRYDSNRPRIYWSNSSTTDGEGDFRVERLRSGTVNIGRRVAFADTGQGGHMSTISHTEQVELEPGKTATVQIGGSGRRVEGRMVPPEDFEGTVPWHMGSVQLYQTTPNTSSNFFYKVGEALSRASGDTTSRATAQQQHRRSYAVAIDNEGRFQIEDVEPGTYGMRVQIYAIPEGNRYNWNPMANYSRNITIPETEEEPAEAIDLGEMELQMLEPPEPRVDRVRLDLRSIQDSPQ